MIIPSSHYATTNNCANVWWFILKWPHGIHVLVWILVDSSGMFFSILCLRHIVTIYPSTIIHMVNTKVIEKDKMVVNDPYKSIKSPISIYFHTVWFNFPFHIYQVISCSINYGIIPISISILWYNFPFPYQFYHQFWWLFTTTN